MYEKSVKVKINTGVHARPAAEMVKLTNTFKSEVSIIKDEAEVNGKSIMGIMMLAIAPQTEIIIRAEGEDEKELVEALVALVEHNFNIS